MAGLGGGWLWLRSPVGTGRAVIMDSQGRRLEAATKPPTRYEVIKQDAVLRLRRLTSLIPQIPQLQAVPGTPQTRWRRAWAGLIGGMIVFFLLLRWARYYRVG